MPRLFPPSIPRHFPMRYCASGMHHLPQAHRSPRRDVSLLEPPRAHLDLLLGEEDLMAWVTMSSAVHPVNGGVQPSISIIRSSRTPRGPETPSTLPVWSPDKSLTMYSTAGAMPSGPSAAPGFSL